MPCLFFCFFLVCLVMHACNARHLGVAMDDHSVYSKEHVFSTQVVESVKEVNKKTSVSLHESDEEKTSVSLHESDEEKPSDLGKQQRETWGGVSVSDEDSGERSGFFSDYSTPRTRPPSHN